jgi:RNA polymerase subunit RPABC4/transcription elongation factor Spt4
MLRRIVGTACVLALGIGVAYAADTMQENAAPTAQMSASSAQVQMLKDQMSHCAVCKAMVPHLDSLGPVMTTEVATLNDGVAIMHDVTDPSKVAELHALNAEMAKAGMACLAMTDEEAKTQLCPFCQETREIAKAGGHISQGDTKMGSMMVVTSSDPAVQKQITDLASKCAMMAEKI